MSTVLDEPEFRRNGAVHGRADGHTWAVCDPSRHPLYVWQKSGSGIFDYGRTAHTLDAVLYTNGPMMGKRLGPNRKVTRALAGWEFVKWTTAGALGGLAVGYKSRFRLACSAGGAGIGMVNAWRRAFTEWLPCGGVVSHDGQIHDRRNFDNEGQRHTWFGRFRTDFPSYCIGTGDLPEGILEGVGGLIRLVQNWKPVSKWSGDANFDADYSDLWHKRGVIAWGLLPLERSSRRGATNGLDGVLVVFGSRSGNLEFAAELLATIGTRDAVATDQRGMIIMGSRRHMLIGPPSPPRQVMQLYGLCCR